MSIPILAFKAGHTLGMGKLGLLHISLGLLLLILCWLCVLSCWPLSLLRYLKLRHSTASRHEELSRASVSQQWMSISHSWRELLRVSLHRLCLCTAFLHTAPRTQVVWHADYMSNTSELAPFAVAWMLFIMDNSMILLTVLNSRLFIYFVWNSRKIFGAELHKGVVRSKISL